MGNPWKVPCAENAERAWQRGDLKDDLVKILTGKSKKYQRSAKWAGSCAYEAGSEALLLHGSSNSTTYQPLAYNRG